VRCFLFLVFASAQGVGQMGADNATTSIQRGTEAAKALQEGSFQTRKEEADARGKRGIANGPARIGNAPYGVFN
jgi:hypothetical protein